MDLKRRKIDEDADKFVSMIWGTCGKDLSEHHFHFGSADFGKVIFSPAFVDKTLLIKSVLTDKEIVLVTAPRRFGKSTNLDMLKRFVEIQVEPTDKRAQALLFQKIKDLVICEDREFFDQHFGMYPVIHINLSSVAGCSLEDIRNELRLIICLSFIQHRYLRTSEQLSSAEKELISIYYSDDKNELPKFDLNGLRVLSQCLYKHFSRKVYIFIDEYDAPIFSTMFTKTVDVVEVNGLLKQFFSNTLKDNPFLGRAFLTGISNFATVALSDIDNIQIYMFLSDHSYASFYGLTDVEVTGLLRRFGIDEIKALEIKEYYSGYTSLGGIKILPIWSILKFLKKKKLLDYWGAQTLQTGGVMLTLQILLDFPIVRYLFEKLCLEHCVQVTIKKKVQLKDIIQLQELHLKPQKKYEKNDLRVLHLFLFFLFQQGYLTYCSDNKGIELNKNDYKSNYRLKLFNAATRNVFTAKLRKYHSFFINAHLGSCADIFNNITINSKEEVFKPFIARLKIFMLTWPQRAKAHEKFYECFMFNMLCKTKFLIVKQTNFSKHIPELIFYRESLGLILNIKYNADSKTAIKEIVERYLAKSYFKKRNCIIENYMYIGVSVNNDNTTVEMRILANSSDITKALLIGDEDTCFC